jgi:hypothetical protein
LLYKKHEDKLLLKENDDYYLIRKYLLNDSNKENTLHKNKPMLFIHIPHEYNARHWLSFGSRSSCELNIPYLYFTLKSIIKNCEESFNIIIIDDSSFEKLIPEWKIQMNLLPDPIKSYTRQLAILKLLYLYGGLSVPIQFLCFKDLITLYENNIGNVSNTFVFQTLDTNVSNTHNKFYPNINFLGCSKNNTFILEVIQYMEISISQDQTNQTNFLGNFDRLLQQNVQNGKINLVDASLIGLKTKKGEEILLDNFMSDEYLDLNNDCYGIYTPLHELLKRRKYEYYLRMNKKQILDSTCILSKYILIASVPSHRESLEGFSNIINNDRTGNENSSIISWYLTPLKPALWGVKPLGVFPKDIPITLQHPV